MNWKIIKKIIVFLVLVLILVIFWQPAAQPTPAALLTIGDAKISIEIAQTPAELTKGLSDRQNLAENSGLFFVFPNTDTHGIWMKEMNFPIDIIWLDENYQIVFIKENATPESYPEVFVSNALARYVLEIPAGFVQKHQLSIGMTASII